MLFDDASGETVTGNHVPVVWPSNFVSFVGEMDAAVDSVLSTEVIREFHPSRFPCSSSPCFEKRQLAEKNRNDRCLTTRRDYEKEMYRMLLYIAQVQQDKWYTKCMRCANAILNRLIISINRECFWQLRHSKLMVNMTYYEFVRTLECVYVCLFSLRSAAKKQGIALYTCDILVRKFDKAVVKNNWE